MNANNTCLYFSD